MRGREAAVLGFVFVSALLVRGLSLGDRCLYLDETATTAAALAPTWGEFWERISTAEVGKGPLYYALVRGWAWVFGESELSLRLPSALAGSFAASLCALWAMWLLDQPTERGVGREGSPGRLWLGGLAAGLIVAAHPTLVALSREARSYSISHAFALLACAGAVPAYLGDPSSRTLGRTAWRVIVPVSAAIAVSMHLFTGFLVAGLFATTGIACFATGLSLRPVVVGAAGFSALMTLQVPLTLQQVGAHYGAGGAAPSLTMRDWGFYCRELLGSAPLAYFLLPLCLLSLARGIRDRCVAVPIGTLLASGGIVLAVHFLVMPIVLSGPRYLAWEAFPLAVVVAVLVRDAGGWVRAGLLCLAVGLPLGVHHQRAIEEEYWEDWRRVAQILDSSVLPDDLVACRAGYVDRPLGRYRRSRAPVAQLTTATWEEELIDLRRAIPRDRAVWLVWSHTGELSLASRARLEVELGPCREVERQAAILVLRFGP